MSRKKRQVLLHPIDVTGEIRQRQQPVGLQRLVSSASLSSLPVQPSTCTQFPTTSNCPLQGFARLLEVRDEALLLAVLQSATVYARMSPDHKRDLMGLLGDGLDWVEACPHLGLHVGFCGDGGWVTGLGFRDVLGDGMDWGLRCGYAWACTLAWVGGTWELQVSDKRFEGAVLNVERIAMYNPLPSPAVLPPHQAGCLPPSLPP